MIDFSLISVTFLGAGHVDINVAPAAPPEVFLNLRTSEETVPEQPESSGDAEGKSRTVKDDTFLS